MKTNYQLLFVSVAILFSVACENKDAFKKTTGGLQYKMHTSVEGPKPAVGDVMTLNMIYKTAKDSVLYNTFENGKPVKTPLTAPSFVGGIEEGFALLAIGDSATFLVPADSLFIKTFGSKLPPFLQPGEMLTFVVKMVDFKSQKALDDEQNAKNEIARNAEAGMLADYIKAQNITVAPTASGIYYVETLAGKGANPVSGQTVKMNYIGKFMDGKVFDSSERSGQPLEFVIGNKMVIDGWEEGIAMMKKGGKATIVIPSNLAYGERGAQNPQSGEYIIPPFTPIVFDVELVDIINKK